MLSSDRTNESIEAKKHLLFKQKQVLDTFLSTGALSPEQYEYSIKNTTKQQRIELIRSWVPTEEFMEIWSDSRKEVAE